MVWENMKKREKKEIKVMCALLYMMGLCLALGISLRPVAKEPHPEDRLIQNSDKSVLADGKMQAGKKSVSVDGKLQLEDGQQMSDYVRKDNEAKKVAITFDDGPGKGTTEKLLDGLKERGVKATFFLVGEKIEDNRELVARMYAEGHLIGNHTFTHVQLSKVDGKQALEEIVKTNTLIEEITGEPVRYIRPPYGSYSNSLLMQINMTPVLWSVDPEDWNTDNTGQVVKSVVANVKCGDIILLHDIYDSSVAAALEIVDELKAKGFIFVTVDQLLLD